MRTVTLLLLSFSLFASSSIGQALSNKQESKPFVLGIVDSIKSGQLSETRVLNIYLPDEYRKDDTANYPVIYLLDGSANEDFIHIVGIVQFLTMIKVMPPSIVIGIANVDRRRDFTFPTKNKKDLKDFPTTGGSAKFILFLEKDLLPYVQGRYRTNTQKTIIGQSLGGLLATEVLLRKPALFNNYIIVSPSLWWDDESLLSLAPGLLSKQSTGDIKVYLSNGSEGTQMQNDANKLMAILHNSKDILLNYFPMSEETHLTILHRSVYKAFEVLNKKE